MYDQTSSSHLSESYITVIVHITFADYNVVQHVSLTGPLGASMQLYGHICAGMGYAQCEVETSCTVQMQLTVAIHFTYSVPLPRQLQVPQPRIR